MSLEPENPDLPTQNSAPPRPDETQSEGLTEADLVRIEAQGNTNAFSRAIAVMILMCLPGVAGHYLDKWLGTQFLILVGFVLGMVIAIWGLLYVFKIADATSKRNRELKEAIRKRG